MAALIDSLPQLAAPAPPAQAPGIALPAAVLDRYVGEYRAASGFSVTFRRDGDDAVREAGHKSGGPARRPVGDALPGPPGPSFEFQLDSQGKVTGATLEQGSQRIPLERT